MFYYIKNKQRYIFFKHAEVGGQSSPVQSSQVHVLEASQPISVGHSVKHLVYSLLPFFRYLHLNDKSKLSIKAEKINNKISSHTHKFCYCESAIMIGDVNA